MHPRIDAAKARAALNDIVSGNNGAFSAGPGWDACTASALPSVRHSIQARDQRKKAGKKSQPR
jgi:kumamolisin